MEKQLAALITDAQFEKLELRMREPNIFRALGVERYEIRHSNFFAFLLDPQETHGLDDIFLRKFLRDIFADPRARGRTLFDADLLNCSQGDVRREWRGIDILIDLPEDVIAVENKVDSNEHTRQLKRYRAIVDEEFAKKRKHFVYLTPFGAEAIEDEDQASYVNYSYEQIAGILENVLALHREAISDKIAAYLFDYLTTIKRELLMNDDLNDLAVKVYKAHKTALDFIFENRPDPASFLYPYLEEELRSRGFAIGSKNKGFAHFTSKGLERRLPRTGRGWPGKEIFLFEIDYFRADKPAVAKAVVCPGDDALRDRILSVVKGLKTFRKPEGKKWSTFYLRKLNFVPAELFVEDRSHIQVQVKQVIDQIASDAKEIFDTIEAALPPLDKERQL